MDIEVDLESLLDDLGFDPMKRVGDEIYALCPAHVERTPSWSIHVGGEKHGLHSCFGCGYSGSLIGLIVDICECSRAEAHQMASSYPEGIVTTRSNRAVKAQYKAPEWVRAQWECFGPVPESVLRSRNISSEVAEAYDLRWDPSAREWLIPIHGPGGELWGWQRKSTSGARTLKGVPKSQALFGYGLLPPAGPIVVVESPLDVFVLAERNVAAVAIFGSQASDEQVSLLAGYDRRVVVAFDNDAAGRRGTSRLLQKWRDRNQLVPENTIRVANYADITAKDVGEMTSDEIERCLTTTIDAWTVLRG